MVQDQDGHSSGNSIGGVTKSAISAMSSQPLSLALLLINVVFLGFSAYVLKQVSENSAERNKAQTEMIQTLIRDCRRVGTIALLLMLAGCSGRLSWVEDVPAERCVGGTVALEKRQVDTLPGRVRNTVTRANACLD